MRKSQIISLTFSIGLIVIGLVIPAREYIIHRNWVEVECSEVAILSQCHKKSVSHSGPGKSNRSTTSSQVTICPVIEKWTYNGVEYSNTYTTQFYPSSTYYKTILIDPENPSVNAERMNYYIPSIILVIIGFILLLIDSIRYIISRIKHRV